MYGHVLGRGPRRRAIALVGITVLVLLVLVYLPVGQFGTPATAGGGNSGLRTAAKPFTPPAALHIPVAGPVVDLVRGDIVNVTYEYEAVTYNATLYHMLLRFPTVFAVFTEPGGGLKFVPVLDREVLFSKGGYNNGTATQSSNVITANTTLDRTVQPFLTTLKLAIMANTSYGYFRLAVRWDYTIWVKANDTTLTSPWSTFGDHQGQESTVTPAQLMNLAWTSPEYTTVGSRFTAELTGLVSGADYWVEVENPFTGISVEEKWTNASVGVTSFNVSILLQYGRGLMTPSPWLVHIHDNHGDILYSIPVYLSSPTTASIYFKVVPSTCGPVEFNGVPRASGAGSHGIGTNQSYSLVAESCSGYTFAGWSQTGGGAQIASLTSASTSAEILYNDTITATYAVA
ncbi:MAG: hypothetical protein WBF81_07640 [Thermoplasmata archaeon]